MERKTDRSIGMSDALGKTEEGFSRTREGQCAFAAMYSLLVALTLA